MNRFQLLLKRGKPLLYLPLDPAAARRGLELYPAQTRKARLLKAGVRLALKLRLRVGRGAAELPIPTSAELKDLLMELAGCESPQLAILAGNPNAPGRRFICMVMDQQAQPKAVVKIGTSETARTLVRREYSILSSIRAATPGVPGTRRLFETDQLSALVLDYVEGRPPARVTSEQLFDFFRAWIREEEPQPIFDFPQMLELRGRAAHPLLLRIREPLRKCRARPALSNGDFAAWNIRENAAGSWTVLDWERGELRSVPCWSWFHFFLQDRILVHKPGPAEIVGEVERFMEDPHFQSYCAICGVAGIEKELMLAYLLHVLRVLKPAEGLGRFQQIFTALEQRWVVVATAVPAVKSAPDSGAATPDVSIITPSYNQLEWLKLCAASVSDQLGVTVEHIVQDAGTPNIESAFLAAERTSGVQRRQDPPPPKHELRLYQEKDSGMYDAINRGFLKARGEIVAWLNCDEQYLPGTLRRVTDYFRNHPEVDVLIGDALLVDDTGQVLSYRRGMRPSLLHTQLAHLATLSCGIFFRRSLITRGLLLDTRWNAIADAEFMVRLLKENCRIAVLNQPLAAFTLTKANLGQSSFLMAEMERWRAGLPAWLRGLTPAVVAFHRIQKLLAGAYGKRAVHTALFRPGSRSGRVEVDAADVSFGWPVLGEESGSLLPKNSFSVTRGTYSADFQTNARRLPTAGWRVTLAGLGLLFVGGILLLDLQIGAVAVTPLFGALTMLALAFFLFPLELALTAVGLGFLIYLSLRNTTLPDSGFEWLHVLLRLASFATASTLAILFSWSRRRSARMSNQTFEVLRRIPAPVIVSDAYGKVRFANAAAVHLLCPGNQELTGMNYTKLLMTELDEGTANRLYRRVFLESARLNQVVELSPQSGARLSAHTALIGERANSLLVTLIKL